ncbi:MAG: CTP synthase [Bacilli bacterium]|nr:CTP synthase [Bacilli bacterium]
MKTKFIFVTGGVVSSLGKGINASSIGRLLKNRGLKVFMQKFDPYINVDPGNMSPLQHGEVYVTDDGAETDLDLGHYERFIDERLNKYSSVTSGKVYMNVLENERSGKYNGGTVQVIPHITNEIKSRLNNAAASSGADVVITEIGGTVGDIEGLPFLEAIRQYRRDIGYANTYYIHNTLVPYVAASKEIKTKPTQHSVKELRSIGINPDMIILRTEKSIDESTKEKIALFCDVDIEAVIEAKDASSIYEIPLRLAEQKVDDIICKHFKLKTKELDMKDWECMVSNMKEDMPSINIALVGQHIDFKDSYISVVESLQHAGYANNLKVNIEPLKASTFNNKNTNELKKYNGIIVPDGEVNGDVSGLLNVIKYARENNVPYLGIGYGMQLAVIEFAKNVLIQVDANSEEIDKESKMPIFIYKKHNDIVGKDMRLGIHECIIKKDTLAQKIYNTAHIKERHRHQYDFNPRYRNLFEGQDLVFSGLNLEDNNLEIVELKNHPFFIACLFHPEFLSRPNRAHPLFFEFIKKAKK